MVSWMLAPAGGRGLRGTAVERGGVGRRAGEQGLVALLDAVAAQAVVSHETEQLAGQRRVRSAARVGVEARGNRLQADTDQVA